MNDIELEFIAWFVICLLIIKFESDKFTVETFCFGNSANIPESSKFWTNGTFTLNGVDVVLLVAAVTPRLTPVTLVVAANVRVFPSVDIFVISLKLGTLPSPLYAMIDPVWIPTFPAKLRFTAVAAVPTMLIWSEGEKPGNTRSYNTVSALKSDGNDASNPSASWNTIFTSSIVNATISLTDINWSVCFSLIIICSPLIKVPVVCDNAISFEPVEPAFLAAYPIAPLDKPLILAPVTTWLPENAPHFNMVNVWIS